ncbi:Erv1/Alr domain-containing protein [Rozella allomycis CSF55]|uniref:Sulfhydryl oxidase n=1 Tax=Rozella allomycis (strain CSF55) TaxID=988480 RepID=A0A075B544_ROZAC|nr:Erv1/Alr domain-containing protein [Rozella allomycis CSF55]|eukprot:EPZ36898.1 Erv1/Alr domain-containing protein [Rozella allomycis CSF55]
MPRTHKQLIIAICAMIILSSVFLFLPATSMQVPEPPYYQKYYSKPATDQLIRAELGHSTWTFLHTLAAKYPANPTAEQKAEMKSFVEMFGRLYPCEECGQHFREMLGKEPPKVESGVEFQKWLCGLHNKVNLRLGKAEFDCERLNERWDCGCKV